MVHKASHHFDLVNSWLRSVPVLVFGLGDLRFYGRENAEQQRCGPLLRARGTGSGRTTPSLSTSPPTRISRPSTSTRSARTGTCGPSVFGDGISIEDDMAVLARYNNGATMSYHLVAYAPWEGYRVMVNGTEGRLELDVEERSYVSGSGAAGRGEGRTSLTLRRLWERPQPIDIEGCRRPRPWRRG